MNTIKSEKKYNKTAGRLYIASITTLLLSVAIDMISMYLKSGVFFAVSAIFCVIGVVLLLLALEFEWRAIRARYDW